MNFETYHAAHIMSKIMQLLSKKNASVIIAEVEISEQTHIISVKTRWGICKHSYFLRYYWQHRRKIWHYQNKVIYKDFFHKSYMSL